MDKELEDLMKRQMRFYEKAPCCGSCRFYTQSTDTEGPKCTANVVAVVAQFFTRETSWCTFYKAKV